MIVFLYSFERLRTFCMDGRREVRATKFYDMPSADPARLIPKNVNAKGQK